MRTLCSFLHDIDCATTLYLFYRCQDNCIVATRMRQLGSVISNLYDAVSCCLGDNSSGENRGKSK